MKTVSIQELKNNLSALLDEVARGERIVVTRHGHPLVNLAPADMPHCNVGKRYGRAKFRAVLPGSVAQRMQALLQNDRSEGGGS